MLLRLLLLVCAMANAASGTVSPTAAYGLSENDIKETVDLSGDGKLKKLIIQEGEGPIPKTGAQISAHYDGKLTDGKQFDSSRKRGRPFEFELNRGRVIRGWDLGFSSMRKGEKAILVIDSEYGYGARGAGGSIPGGATLYFEVELVDFKGGK